LKEAKTERFEKHWPGPEQHVYMTSQEGFCDVPNTKKHMDATL